MIINKSILSAAALGLSLLTGFEADAQMKRLRGIRDEFSSQNKMDVIWAKSEIDIVLDHPDTKDLCAAWGWKGVVYAELANSQDPEVMEKNADKSAAYQAGEAFLRYFSCSKEDQAVADADKVAPNSVANAIFACWNMGYNAIQVKGNYAEVKKYMGMVEKLIPYDADENAKNQGVTREQALNVMWRAAYMDSLVDEEVSILEKLIAIPNYMNADIYIRMAEILSERKQYDKALDYLEQGKVKIPQKAGSFLESQINIEITRGNMSALLKKYDEAIVQNPDNPMYYFYRGIAYHKLKEDDLREQDAAHKNNSKVPASKYFFTQAQQDYSKALELDPGLFDAVKNDAILMFDSANYIYKMRVRVASSDYAKYDALSIALYKQSLEKFEKLRASGYLKDEELVELLKDMKSICIKINDEEQRNKYEGMLKSEKKKLQEKEGSTEGK